MHSGTTLLLNVLQKNRAVFSGRGETKYFDHLPMIRRAYPHLDDDRILRDFILFVMDVVEHGHSMRRRGDAGVEGASMARERLDAILAKAKRLRDHEFIFPVVFDHLARASGKTRWMEKTPSHVYHIDRILRCIPDALFVEIVRDPRDVLASKKTRRLTVWDTDRYAPEQRPFKHLEKAYDPLWDSLSWKSAVCAGRLARGRYPGHVLSIRYEDLVRCPESQIRKMCDFLNLGFEPEMLNISSGNPAEWGNRETGGITTDSVGRWRRVLTLSEAALCQWLVRSEMEQLEYRRTVIPFAQAVKAPVVMLRGAVEFVQRLLRRWWLGGFPYLMNVIVNYWRRLRKLADGRGPNK